MMLSVKNLHVSFRSQGKKIYAVQGVSFDQKEGEKLGIVGESGSGKSALVKAFIQLIPRETAQIDEGEVWFNGKNLAALSEHELQKVRGREIGMIFQDPMTSLNPTQKIGVQIGEGILRHFPSLSSSTVRKQVIDLLAKVGIPDPERRFSEFPHTLSGGLRQRILIAIALAAEPKLLIADEPTTALDVTVQAQILELMKQFETSRSTILISHDLSVVAGFCDRILVMYAGKIVEDAPVEELFAHPKHPYTQKLLKALPRLDLEKSEMLQPIMGSPPDLRSPSTHCAFCPRCPQAMNICRKESPPLFDLGQEHKVACWLYDKRCS